MRTSLSGPRSSCRLARPCSGHGTQTADPDFGEVAGEKWLILLPNKWNPTTATVNGWRYDPRELSSAPVRDDARRRGGTRLDE